MATRLRVTIDLMWLHNTGQGNTDNKGNTGDGNTGNTGGNTGDGVLYVDKLKVENEKTKNPGIRKIVNYLKNNVEKVVLNMRATFFQLKLYGSECQ